MFLTLAEGFALTDKLPQKAIIIRTATTMYGYDDYFFQQL